MNRHVLVLLRSVTGPMEAATAAASEAKATCHDVLDAGIAGSTRRRPADEAA